MRSKLDLVEVEAGTFLASTLLGVYRYLSPTRARLKALEAGQAEIKSEQSLIRGEIREVYALLIELSKPPTRRKARA